MRVYKKKEILNLIESMRKIHKRLYTISQNCKDKEYDCLNILQETAIVIGGELEATRQKDIISLVKILEEYCEDVYQCSIIKNSLGNKFYLEQMDKKILVVRNKLLNEIETDRLEVVFLPYKADMWTSLESIWIAAKKDTDCNVTVMPIPYYDIGDANNVRLKYEADRFPSYVEIVNYKSYSLEKHHPDMIFIHNPYDERNTLTRVPKCYYSSALREMCGCLVYSPYFTVGTYKPEAQEFMFTMPGVYNADYVIAQSQRVKELFEFYGKESNKILAYGSPKIDAIVNNVLDSKDISIKWEKKLRGKKTFLINTHLSYFPNAYLRTNNLENYATKCHREIVETFLNRDDCALIWRPHPFLKNMLQDNYPELLEFVNWFEKNIRESTNGVVDEEGSYLDSFRCSDALISTWSSLINEYMVTEKQILIMQGKMDDQTEKAAPINRNINYFRVGKGKISFKEFRDNVVNGIDPLKKLRREEIEKAFPNLDGNAGEKIYKYLKNAITRE